MLYAIVLFVLTYVLMLAFGKYRVFIALGSGIAFIITGMLPASEVFEAIDWNVLLMIAGMMGLVQLFIDSKMPALLADMVMDHVHSVQMAAADYLAKLGGGNVFLLYTIIVWVSVLISAFIDNIPYTAAMLPVVEGVAATIGIQPAVLYFGLLSGATLGGNCTPIGASANITGIGILRREGYTVRTKDFVRIGVPFTLSAVIPAYIYLWMMFGIL